MKLYHIVATSGGGVIGKEGKLPWHYPEDLKRFKETTMGSTIIMGRKTFESIKKALPGRENFVVTHTPQENKEHLKFFNSVEAAIQAAPTSKVFIIGGASIYEQTINQVDGIYFTKIPGNYEGDAFYPEIPPNFKPVSNEPSATNPNLKFIFYQRS